VRRARRSGVEAGAGIPAWRVLSEVRFKRGRLLAMVRTVAASLADLASSVADGYFVSASPDATTLLIAFAGIGPRDRPPTFSFLNAVADLHASKVFVRDPHRAWYHRGVPGLGESIDEVAAALKRIAGASGARRVVTLGTSVGAYAAVLFGRLIDADLVLAFAPPTVIGWRMRIRTRNTRYLREWLALQLSPRMQRQYVDLRRVLAASGKRPVPVSAHYAAGDRIDAAYAEYLRGVPGVSLHPHPGAGHDLARRLRDDGKLPGLLGAVVEPRARKTS
jgi:hypothetical protein